MDQIRQGFSERRRSQDRRHRSVPSFKSLLIYRRRRNLRRASDRQGLVLLDYYHPTLMLSAIAILILSMFDAVLTLLLMNHGAVELNPVMAFFIERGDLHFIAAKYTLTAVSVFTVVVFNYYFIRYLRIHARHLLHFFALGFAMVIAWEVVLALRHVL